MENRINQSDAGKIHELNWSSALKKTSGSPPPIQPLKLPTFPRLEPIPAESLPETVSAPEPTAVPEQRPIQSKTPPERPSLPSIAQLIEPALAIKPRHSLQWAITNLRQQRWSWTMTWLVALCLFGGMGTSAYLWLTGLPPLPNCNQVNPASSGVQRFYCAQEIARSGQLPDLVKAITMLNQAGTDLPYDKEAQKLIEQWSKVIIVIAHQKIDQSDLQGAIAAVNQIPKTSPAYAEGQEVIAHWQDQWKQGETLYAKAQEAIAQQNWREASYLVSDLGLIQHDYWRIQQADVLSKQISLEKQARAYFVQAQKLAKGGNPTDLGEAIVVAQNVAPNTHAWQETQPLVQQWSQRLISIALQNWSQGNITDAVAIAQNIPFDQNLPPEAKDLVQFSHAYTLVSDTNSDNTSSNSRDRIDGTDGDPSDLNSFGQLWNFLEAISAASQITSDSPIYTQAQVNVQNWQSQLQDVVQLQLSKLMASLGGPAELQLAIAQASQLAPESTRRAQAQTLIQQWQEEIERLADLPYLIRAQRFAEAGKIPDLKLAIAQASVIPGNRAAATEAQTLIAGWNRQIEVIEDQPLWDKAQSLAKQKNWLEAIDTVAQIQPNRALYEKAQAAIEQWKTAIRNAEIAKDKPILEKAQAFADRNDLTMAIATAAEISPGRPLYLEAQGAIKVWLELRDGKVSTDSDNSTNSTDERADRGTDSAASPDISSDPSESAQPSLPDSSSDMDSGSPETDSNN